MSNLELASTITHEQPRHDLLNLRISLLPSNHMCIFFPACSFSYFLFCILFTTHSAIFSASYPRHFSIHLCELVQPPRATRPWPQKSVPRGVATKSKFHFVPKVLNGIIMPIFCLFSKPVNCSMFRSVTESGCNWPEPVPELLPFGFG